MHHAALHLEQISPLNLSCPDTQDPENRLEKSGNIIRNNDGAKYCRGKMLC